MSQITEKVQAVLEREIETVERIRDELRVQAHLMKADMKSRWNDLDKKWEEYRANPAHKVGSTAHELAADFKRAYEQIKSDLKRMSPT